LIAHAPGPHAGRLYEVKLLEINAEPAIELTGPRLTWILEDLFISIGIVCAKPFLEGKQVEAGWALGETRYNLIKCLEEKARA
jgi:tubulin---tyrosine ligase